MQIDPPLWHLSKMCPACGQGASLALVACAVCGKVSVECTEEGTQFANALSLKPQGRWQREGAVGCPHCNAIASLHAASSDEIQAAGLVVGQYE